MTPSAHAAADYSLGFYARQPVFDETGKLRGYSLYFRGGQDAAVPAEACHTGATNSVLAAIVGEAPHGLRHAVKFTAASLVYDLPLLLPKESLVVEVHERLAGDAQAMDALRRLKDKGYLVSVSHFGARPEAALLYALADVLWVDALAHDGERLAGLAEACRQFPAKAGLMRIEDRCVFERARALGFRLFQGHYFQQPETMCTRKLSSSQFSRLKLLQVIEQEDPDLKMLAETIRADVGLSYKLFGLLNSAHFSLPAPVHSVKQALALIGWEPLRTWIRLVILTDMSPGKTSELPRSATLRGRFLELCAQTRTLPPGMPAPLLTPESLFLLGLFSLLPAMLDQPMTDILGSLVLPEPLRKALLGQSEMCSGWLKLAECFERADWAGVQAGIERMALDPVNVATAYAQATEWTDALFRSVPA